MASSPVSLPYAFDTTDIGKTVLKGAVLVEIFLLAGLLYHLLVTHAFGPIIECILLIIIVGGFAYKTFRRSGGSSGVITAANVRVTAARMYGICSKAAEGDFPLERFESVLIEHVTSLTPMYVAPFERIYLKGNAGTPTILITHAKREQFGVLGQKLGAALKLMVEEKRLGR